ncbi:MAG: alpha/beta fold hydrolase [Bacillota bacterium]
MGTESIYYAASGVAEAGSAILFLHESGGTGATWIGQLTGLAQKVRCLVPDLPGHGHSEGLGFQSIAEYRRAMLAFLDALAIRWPVVIAGVCLGAAIAVDLALHAPERVAGLILVGVREGGRVEPEAWERTALGEAPDSYVEQMFSEKAPSRLKSDQLKRWRLAGPTVRYGDLVAMARYPLAEAVRHLRQPLVAVAGERDPVATPATAVDLALQAPRGTAAVIPQAGCMGMLEQPERFNQLVRDFLDEVRPNVPVMPVLQVGGYRRFRSG